MKFIKITCPSCGDTFDPPENQPFAFCRSCGSKIVIEREPQTDPTSNLELGKQYLRAGNYKEADEQFSRALEKDPNFGEAWFWKGVCGIKQFNWGATEYLKKSGITDSEFQVMLNEHLTRDQWLTVVTQMFHEQGGAALPFLETSPLKDIVWLQAVVRLVDWDASTLLRLVENAPKECRGSLWLILDWRWGTALGLPPEKFLSFALTRPSKREESILAVLRTHPEILRSSNGRSAADECYGGIRSYLYNVKEKLLWKHDSAIRMDQLQKGVSPELESTLKLFLETQKATIDLGKFLPNSQRDEHFWICLLDEWRIKRSWFG